MLNLFLSLTNDLAISSFLLADPDTVAAACSKSSRAICSSEPGCQETRGCRIADPQLNSETPPNDPVLNGGVSLGDLYTASDTRAAFASLPATDGASTCQPYCCPYPCLFPHTIPAPVPITTPHIVTLSICIRKW